jgi:hypothetical protein
MVTPRADSFGRKPGRVSQERWTLDWGRLISKGTTLKVALCINTNEWFTKLLKVVRTNEYLHIYVIG